eukprot:COSAG05_NODE_87_length_20404_cov_42.272051_18_plen_110_part_00
MFPIRDFHISDSCIFVFSALFCSLARKQVGNSNELPELIAEICGLGDQEVGRLLRHVRDWNTRQKSAYVAQAVLNAILLVRDPPPPVSLSGCLFGRAGADETHWALIYT